MQENCPRDPTTSSVVYGLAVAGCVVALITLDARVEGAPTRTLLVVDFSDVTLDFWNAVGVSFCFRGVFWGARANFFFFRLRCL